MDKDDVEPFKEVMDALGLAFGTKITDALTELYWRALSGLTLDAIKEAIARLVLKSTFMPRVADIAIAAGASPDMPPECMAALCAQLLLDSIRRYGSYTSVRFTDVILNKAVRELGGWPTVCAIESKEIDFFVRRFEKIYIALTYVVGQAERDWMNYLPGLHELKAQADGREYTGPGPVLIAAYGSPKLVIPASSTEPHEFLDDNTKWLDIIERTRRAKTNS